MLKECIEIFEKQLEEHGDNLILHSYIPADGTYIIVAEDGSIKATVDIKLDKKTREINKDQRCFDEICFYDYNSKLTEINKSIDRKKVILSNNYLSFVIKKENIKSGKLTEEIIDVYYDILTEPLKKYNNSSAADIYKEYEEKSGIVDINKLNKNKRWIKENIFSIEKLGIDITGKDYLKIFFDDTRENYIKESERYLLPNIYNSNDYNIIVNDKIYGIPNDNMGMNAKKPYLAAKTRKLPASYTLDQEEVLMQKKFFDYLMNLVSAGNYNVFVDQYKGEFKALKNDKVLEEDFSGFFLRLQKGKNEAEIHHYDMIPYYHFKLKKWFSYSNILGQEHKFHAEWNDQYKDYNNKYEIQHLINEVLFSKCLINNYFTKPEDLSLNDGYLKDCILYSRDTIFNWIYKESDYGFFDIMNKVTLEMVKGSIIDGFYGKAVRQFNFRWSLIKFFKEGIDMEKDLLGMYEEMKIKAKEEIPQFDNSNQFYFAVGQIVNFFISLNKSSNKTQSLANPFFNAKSIRNLKEKLNQLYVRYNYDIYHNSGRFNKIYQMIVAYESDEAVNQDMMIAGYLCKNLILTKEEKEESQKSTASNE